MKPSMTHYFAVLRRFLPRPVSIEQGRNLHRELTVEATWSTNFVVLIISSCAIATFGLISNSTAVIIGAMLIAPLMLPLRAFAFAALEGDLDLLKRSLFSIVGGTLLSVGLAMVIGLVTPIPSFGSEFQARVQPSLVDLGIALAAGGISGFAKVRDSISDALAGTAIAVALMPPICVVGLSIAKAFDTPSFWVFSQQAMLLYLTNLLGIVLACMLVFILAGYAEVSHSITWAMISVALLFIPLGANFISQIRQARVEDYIRTLVVRNTVTIGQQDVTLVDTRIDWGAKIPIVYLNVQVSSNVVEGITAKQVQEVQRFISQQVGRPLKLVIFVSRGQTVTEDGVNEAIEDAAPSAIDRDRPLIPDSRPLPIPSPSPVTEILIPEKFADPSLPTLPESDPDSPPAEEN
ncbi:DUF389 domain-containing protein [Spirulina major]|uniref:DUF389 domain-containing protein n=1 Tax=Spirulina major TaxID=270636 RepID=UPI0009FDB514|nr:DUF389 domain-containing protein [Spirulina major]